MDERRLAELLRIKRAREQRATARAAQAEAEAAQAMTARLQAEQAEAQHAAERPTRETAAYRRLLSGPLPARTVQSETALLSGMAAYAGILRGQTSQATIQAADRAEATRTARAVQTTATRGTEAALAITRAVASLTVTRAEQAAELDDEDLGPAQQARIR